MIMPVLPFHRYIGPGNDINSGPCVDADDCIAKKHDIKYENAKTAEDVRLADVEAIEEFRANWLGGNWHSLIGDIGLSLKYCVETYTGVIYPKLGNYEPCEIISLFHEVLKLHCVNKVRLVDRYSHPILVDQIECPYDFTKFKNCESWERFFYILVMWYQLYHKSQAETSPSVNLITKPTLTTNEMINHVLNDVMLGKSKYFPVPNSSLVKNCDIFNLKAWIRFFSMIRQKQQTSFNDYNDEDLSSMFLQYD